jgi:hypothetical protein
MLGADVNVDGGGGTRRWMDFKQAVQWFVVATQRMAISDEPSDAATRPPLTSKTIRLCPNALR